MKRNFLHLAAVSAAVLLSAPVWASGKIHIDLRSNYPHTAAVGYQVNHQQHGNMGDHYKGTGPANAVYQFGVRKNSVFGQDVDCGALMLSQDARVILQEQNGGCKAVLG